MRLIDKGLFERHPITKFEQSLNIYIPNSVYDGQSTTQ